MKLDISCCHCHTAFKNMCYCHISAKSSKRASEAIMMETATEMGPICLRSIPKSPVTPINICKTPATIIPPWNYKYATTILPTHTLCSIVLDLCTNLLQSPFPLERLCYRRVASGVGTVKLGLIEQQHCVLRN